MGNIASERLKHIKYINCLTLSLVYDKTLARSSYYTHKNDRHFLENTNFWGGCGVTGTFRYSWWECKSVQSLSTPVWLHKIQHITSNSTPKPRTGMIIEAPFTLVKTPTNSNICRQLIGQRQKNELLLHETIWMSLTSITLRKEAWHKGIHKVWFNLHKVQRQADVNYMVEVRRVVTFGDQVAAH